MEKDDEVRPLVPAIDRRDLMRIGAGVALASLKGPALLAQEEGEGRGGRRAVRPEGVPAITSGPGYKYTANRVGGNGPMDALSRQIASFTTSFSDANLTEPVVAGLNKLMMDALTAWIGSFGSEIGQICARLAKLSPAGELKSTVAGYGLTSEPVAAAFANCYMVRQADYDDGDPGNGGHASVVIPGILAIAEAVHATGAQTLTAVALAYEFLGCAQHPIRTGERPAGGGLGWADPAEGIATAIACCKLMGLNEDRIGNAISLALVGHLSLGKGDGTQSHFKEGHSAFNIRNGVFAALCAREGMTGPNAPFDGAEGLFEKVTGPFELKMPRSPLGVVNFRVKRYPAEGNAQALLHQTIPEVHKFAPNIDDIESIHIEVDFGTLREIASPECWDPSNRETADHSLPYMVAAALVDGGEVYLSSYSPQRYLHDAKIKAVMNKITVQANPGLVGTQGRSKTTVKRKDGQTFSKTIQGEVPMKYEEVLAKFDRVCAYMSIPNDVRDKTKATWSNLKAVKDVAEPMRALGNLGGKTYPLTGGTPRS